MKTQWILTVLIFTKIHLEKSHFIFVTRIMLFELSAPLLFYVCGGFNIFFLASSSASIYQPQTVRRAFAENHFVVQTYCKTPAALTNLTKHTVEPQCRCSCDFCPTSPVALLEISETSLKPS